MTFMNTFIYVTVYLLFAVCSVDQSKWREPIHGPIFHRKTGNTAGMSSKAYLVRMKFHPDFMSWQLVHINKIFSETIGS
jgi:hypothetical protein